jgi:hypothetical protein
VAGEFLLLDKYIFKSKEFANLLENYFHLEKNSSLKKSNIEIENFQQK